MPQYMFVDRSTNRIAGSYGLSLLRTPAGDVLAPVDMELARAEIVRQTGLAAEDLLPYELTGLAQAEALIHPRGALVVTVQDGVVISIAPAPEPSAVYLHLGIGGGDGDDPPGIVNDGQQALLVDVALRAGPDPGSPVLPVSGDWRVTIRDDTGAIYDVVRLTITAGQAQVSYTSNQRPAICQILERDFYPVQAGGVTYQVRLVGSTVFKVYRVL